MSIENAKISYLNESNELLDEMESALLNLENDPDNEEMINAIFRAAHTIKGTGGIFGFDDVERFTHVVENVLDSVRNGEIGIDSNMTAVLLSSSDHMRMLVEHAVNNEQQTSDETDKGQELLNELNAYINSPDTKLAEQEQEESTKTETIEKGNIVANENWHISVRFNRDVIRNGMDPLSFLRYLRKDGEILHVGTLFDKEITLDSMDPEECYVGLEIVYKSDCNKEYIEKAFEFVKDDCSLYVLPPMTYIQNYVDLIEGLPENEQRIGEMLVEIGALTRAELDEAIAIQIEHQAGRMAGDTDIPKTRIGDIIVDNGMAHKEVVEAAADKQTQVRTKQVSNKTFRVDAMKLDELVNLVGEMVIAGAGSNLIAQRLADDDLIESMSVMSRLVEEIRDSALRLRMVQIGETFNRFQRVVHDVGKELKKDIKLEINGAETELDKTVVEKIGDPLMHLVRNAMDHGIEPETVRLSSNKSGQGTLQLNAYHDSGSIVIEVIDDGGGLDRKVILGKAMEKGIVGSGQNLSDQEVFRLIFEPGFSTAAAITNLSGRGVGMDVVRRNIESLRGTVDIESELGVGTKVTIRLPLTLAIIDGFLVSVSKSSYVIPLDMIFECVELTEEERELASRQNYINLRGEVLPLLRLRDHFQIGNEEGVRENIVVVQCAGVKAGLVVDELIGEFQTVIKPLGKIFQGLKGISGSTILGTGEVAVILDVPGLVQQVTEMHAHLLRNKSTGQGSSLVH